MYLPPSLLCVLLWSLMLTYLAPPDSLAAVPAMLLAWVLARVLFHRRAK